MRWIKISEEQAELENEAFALSGQSRAYKDASSITMGEATDAFTRGDDDTADLLRDLARRLRTLSLDAWTKHEEVRAAAVALGQCEDIEEEPGGEEGGGE